MARPVQADVDWRGDQLVAAMQEACRRAVNETMSECVIHAKRNHPNWNNETGRAEGSVRIISPAAKVGDSVVGVWGSQGTNYAVYLEADHGPWLRAAQQYYAPRLADHVRKHFKAVAK